MQSLLQTKEWATLRQGFGWQVHWVDEILVLEKPLPIRLSFLYAPEVDFAAIKNIDNFLENIKKNVQKTSTIFLRLDFIDEFDQNIIEKLKQNGFIKAFEEIQPEFRQIIDIDKSEEEILAQMKPKGRYNIKIAQKHGVEIVRLPRPSTSSGLAMTDGIDDFYNIFRETAKRDGFEIRPKAYFEKLLEILGDKAELLVAKYQGQILASAIITCYDETASYLYGASSREHREVMAPYLLHWEAIKLAKEKGCRFYDLLAIAPENIENHKYSGITRFKEQFGGRKVHLVGGWDLVYKPTWYKMFKMAEKLRRR